MVVGASVLVLVVGCSHSTVPGPPPPRDPTTTTTTTTTTVTTSAAPDPLPPRLVLDPVPEGLVAGRFGGAVVDPEVRYWTPLSVFGDPSAEHPFASADLGILMADSAMHAPVLGDGRVVRGHPAELQERHPVDAALCLAWQEEASRTILLASDTLSEAALLAIADGLVIDDDQVTLGPLPPDLPGPLEPVATGTVTRLRPLSRAQVVLPRHEGYMTQYREPDPPGVYPDRTQSAGVYVMQFTASPSDLALMRWTTKTFLPTTVRGHAGGVSADGTTVLWEESQGWYTLVHRAVKYLEIDVHAVAESLHVP